MSIIERNSNGTQSRHEPRREEDILTPEALGVTIAAEVRRALRSDFIDGLKQSALAVAEKMVGSLGQQIAHLLGKQLQLTQQTLRTELEATHATLKAAMESWDRDIRASATGMAALRDQVTQACKMMETEVRGTTQRLIEIGKGYFGMAENASVQRLSAIIGKEVAQYELEQLIREEVRVAVKMALRELNGPPLGPAAPTPPAGPAVP